MESLAEDTYICPPLLNQAIVSEFCSRGLLQDQISRLVTLYTPRWRAAVESVKQLGGKAYAADGGFVVGIELPTEANIERLHERSRAAGVVLSPGQPFYAEVLAGMDAAPDRFLRLPFCALTENEFSEGMRRLASIL